MGRGLSDLQRYIVAKAATVKRLYYAEILQEYYGWRNHGRLTHVVDQAGGWTGEKRHSPGSQQFWPDEIGRAQYHQVHVTLSRACERLDTRGLVTCLSGTKAHWSGVEITPEGQRLAEQWRQAADTSNG